MKKNRESLFFIFLWRFVKLKLWRQIKKPYKKVFIFYFILKTPYRSIYSQNFTELNPELLFYWPPKLAISSILVIFAIDPPLSQLKPQPARFIRRPNFIFSFPCGTYIGVRVALLQPAPMFSLFQPRKGVMDHIIKYRSLVHWYLA